ncbi:hypothetical protein ACNKHM_16965 [Shigella sonnei]
MSPSGTEGGDRRANSVEHLKRSDELGLTLRAVGQLGLMCRWLINDVSSQVSSVRNGSETLAKGTDELNEHTQQTVDNVQQTVATMNQMAASVNRTLPRRRLPISFLSPPVMRQCRAGRR